LASKATDIREKKQNKGYYTIQYHSGSSRSVNQKPVCDFLLVIDSTGN